MSIKPLPPHDAGGQDWRDKSKGGFDLRSLTSLVRDTNEESEYSWRAKADLCHAYYDGKQLNEQQQLWAQSEGLVPRSTNLIQRVINAVLGYEAKSRSDVRIESDSDEIADVVDVFNDRMKEAQREAFVDMAVSSAYGGQVKGGVHWVEVSRAQDPLDYPYRVQETHRSEMYWDRKAKDFMLRDARWLCRIQWHDLDELEAAMPDHAPVLRQMAGSWEGWMANAMIEEHSPQQVMARTFDEFRRFSVSSSEWLDTTRKRVKLYEVWYKVPAQAVVIRLGPTRVILFDEKNQLHQQVVQRGLVKLEKVLTRQIRKAIFAGPYRLVDEGTTKRHFPYVPFFAFRDDEDGSPFGLIDGMISPQDEYNERRLRIQWLLKARQVFADNDALDLEKNNWVDLENNVQRPDMLLVLNANRKNPEGIRVQSNLQLQKEQYDVMQDAKMLIQDVPGVYGAQLGNAQTGVTSGVAISGLVEQGIVAMGELNDNYRIGRRMVHELLLDLIVDDHSEANLALMVGQGSARRQVVLNTFDKQGLPVNMTKDVPIRVGMSDAPATPAARMQQQTMIAEIIKSLGNFPQGAAVLVPAFLESSSLDSETRRVAAEDFRKVMGLPPGGSRQQRAQADAQAAQQSAAQAQSAQQAQQLQLQDGQAKVGETLANTELKKAQTKLALVKAAQDDQQQRIDEALAEADGTNN